MIDGLKRFGSAVSSFSNNLYGISLAYQDEVNAFFNSRYGFNLFESGGERCKINDIELEWVEVTGDDRSSSVKTHALEDRESTLISSNVTNENRKYSLKVILTNYKTNNPELIYSELVELWQNKRLCTISTNETIEDMIITKISRAKHDGLSIEFSIDFEVLEFAYSMRQGQILETEKTILNKEQKTGIAGTKESGIAQYKGFLEKGKDYLNKADRLKNFDLEVLNEIRNR